MILVIPIPVTKESRAIHVLPPIGVAHVLRDIPEMGDDVGSYCPVKTDHVMMVNT